MWRMWCGLLAVCLAINGVSAADPPESNAYPSTKLLGRGINLGNALEAPSEGEWGVTLKESYFAAIKKAGFHSVRLPVKWSNHAAKEAPYTIEPKFLARVDWAVEQAKKNGLAIIVNVHHYDEIMQDPAAHEARLAGIWKQLAEHYREQPASVYFELLNEPHNKLSDEAWNAMFPKILAIMRKSNPTRIVVIGPSSWSNVNNLANMKLPDDDRHIVATFHYYLPSEFTHQGAPWQAGADQWKGREWGSEKERATLASDFQKAADWSQQHNRPLLLGEFGVFSAADMAQRVKWTKAVVKEAEKHGFAWSYWEFCSGFGAYDPEKDVWREELLGALMQK